MNKLNYSLFLPMLGGALAWGGSASTAFGQSEPVLHFEGIESVIQTELTASDLGVGGGNPKTIEAWVKPRVFGWQGVVQLGDRGTAGGDFTLRVAGENNLWHALFWVPPDQEFFFEIPDSINNWTHVALTYDGTTVRAYGNGVLVQSQDLALNTQNGPFEVGKWFQDDSFDGIIRDVRVWSVARSESEIQATMGSSPAGQSGLVLWWPLDEGEGRAANDQSGNGRNGTIFAAQWEALQFEYDPELEADFVFDFGTAPGKTDELSLLRNRPDHFSLQEDALRMTTVSERFISSSAVASVANREARQNFTLESEFRLNRFPDPRASRVGLVALGGPHVPVEAPFVTSREEGFFTLSFFPGIPTATLSSLFPGIEPAGSDTAVIAIGQGFDGPFLAAARWDGRKPLPSPTLLDEDFEDPANDAEWQTGGTNDSWEIGVPAYGPPPPSGIRIAATNLDAAIDPNTEDWLRSPLIDLSGVDSALLTFREALQIDDDTPFGSDESFHNAYVRLVDVDGNPIVELANYSGDSEGWRERSFSIPQEALGQLVRVEFHVSTDNFVLQGEHGWMIDNVTVSTVQEGFDPYVMKAEGSYGFLGELDLTFTLTDLAGGGDYSQSISTTIQNPREGNLFGIGGRLQTSPVDHPEVDFRDFSMTLGEVQTLTVPITASAIFQYWFGTDHGRVAPDNFALSPGEDWGLQSEALRLTTGREAGNSVAVTSVREFRDGNPIQVAAEAVLSSHEGGSESKVGLVLFGEEDPLLFNPDESATYYTFQYIDDGNGNGRIAFREGMDGTILYQAPFTAAPLAGTTYRFEFDGAFNDEGTFVFTATLDDGHGGQASLNGEIAESLELRNRFGMGAAQGGGDVWDILSFTGNTTNGRERFLEFDGTGGVIVETDANAAALRIEGANPKTIEAWVYARAFDGGGVIQLGSVGTDSRDFSLRAGQSLDQWQGQFWGDADMFFTVPGSFNTWTHIAIAYDGAVIEIFANGELVADQTVALDTHPGGGLSIGNWLFNPFNGAIRDVRVWNVVRTGAQVQATMHLPPVGEPGLAGWWPLNDGAGAVAHDLSGQGRDGAISVARWTEVGPGSLGVGLEQLTAFVDFDGTNTRIETELTALDLDVDGAKPKTIEAWVKPRDFSWQGVIQLGTRGPDAGNDFSLRVSGREDHEWHGLFWGTDLFFIIPDSLDTWTHVAFTYDGQTLRAYGNGELIEAINISLNTRNGPLEIGKWAGDPPFDGGIRDVRVWNVARSQSEIREFMNTSPAGQAGLAGWWPLDEGTGVSARDASVLDGTGADRAGTIVSPQWDSDPALRVSKGRVVRNATPIALEWSGLFATGVRIAPNLGDVGTRGSVEMVVPGNRVTTYVLTASDKERTSAGHPMAWVRSVPEGGFESVRYLRFDVPGDSALRDPEANSIQLSRVLFYRDDTRVDPVAVTNPGGDNPPGEGPGNLLGDDPNTRWRDLNKAHLNDSRLVFDFGGEVEIDSYRLGTASDNPGRDPIRWTLYGRNSDQENWRLIESMDLEYPTPFERRALTSAIPLAGPVDPGITFSDWLDLHFPDPEDRANPDLVDPLATPANDGVANLLKYAFGFDPWMSVGQVDLPRLKVENNLLTIKYLERVGVTDIDYVPEKSFVLSEWDEDGLQEIAPREPVGDGEFEWVTVGLELDGQPRAFLRVLVRMTD